MKLAQILPFFLALSTAANAALVTKTIDYTDEKGGACEGFVTYDDAISGPRPGVIASCTIGVASAITHTTAAPEMLARLGYIAFAADIYGKEVHPQSVPEYGKQATIYKSDRALYRQRLRAGYETFLKQPLLDTGRVAAIGYCFGGTGVIEMARDGVPVKGVVSFHGGLDAQPLTPGATIKAKVLALCGADDPHQPAADLAAFEQQLRENNVDYQIVSYGHAVHAFTEKDVDAMNVPGAKYNAEADRRSWQAMQDFLAEIFGQPK